MAQWLLPRNYQNLLPVDAIQCHRVTGIISVAGQLAYHVLRTASVKWKNTVNGHTKKIEHAVETDEEEELSEPQEERKSEDEG